MGHDSGPDRKGESEFMGVAAGDNCLHSSEPGISEARLGLGLVYNPKGLPLLTHFFQGGLPHKISRTSQNITVSGSECSK